MISKDNKEFHIDRVNSAISLFLDTTSFFHQMKEELRKKSNFTAEEIMLLLRSQLNTKSDLIILPITTDFSRRYFCPVFTEYIRNVDTFESSMIFLDICTISKNNLKPTSERLLLILT